MERQPTPISHDFLLCRQIRVDEVTQECSLVSPVVHVGGRAATR